MTPTAWAVLAPFVVVGLAICIAAWACARTAKDDYEPYDPEGR